MSAATAPGWRSQRSRLVRGRVWANLIAKPYLVVIDPATGEVVDIVDARMIRPGHPDTEKAKQIALSGAARMTKPAEPMSMQSHIGGSTVRYQWSGRHSS